MTSTRTENFSVKSLLRSGVGEDDIDDPAGAAQGRRPNVHSGQREILPELLGGLGVDRRIAHGHIVERAMLVGGAGIAGQLQDATEEAASVTGPNCRGEPFAGEGIALSRASRSKE